MPDRRFVYTAGSSQSDAAGKRFLDKPRHLKLIIWLTAKGQTVPGSFRSLPQETLGPVEKVYFELARVRLDFSCEKEFLGVLSFHPL
jgi:hypothetical protein